MTGKICKVQFVIEPTQFFTSEAAVLFCSSCVNEVTHFCMDCCGFVLPAVKF